MSTLAPGDGALFVLPSQRVQAKLVTWRRLYDPEHWRTIPPHITVAYPFVRREAWPALQPAFAACLQAFQPFWIKLAELGAFEHPQSVLWFRPDDGGRLAQIHAALTERFPTHVQAGPLDFVPHLTVGFFDSPAAEAQARAAIETAWHPLRFRVRSLCYATLHDDGIWRACHDLPLRGRQSGGIDDDG
jgi:2'-5' RNA ligase